NVKPDSGPSPESWRPLRFASRNLLPLPLASEPGGNTSTTAESQIVSGASPSVFDTLPIVAVPVVHAVLVSGSGLAARTCVHVYVTLWPAASGSPEPAGPFGPGIVPGSQTGSGGATARPGVPALGRGRTCAA